MDRIDLIPSFFFFNDTATTEIYTLSLHDALPISRSSGQVGGGAGPGGAGAAVREVAVEIGRGHPERLTVEARGRSEEHTSELQSRQYLVCRLLLEKKTVHSINTHLLNSLLFTTPY